MYFLRFHAVLMFLPLALTGRELVPRADYVEMGSSQDQLREQVSSALNSRLPHDTTVLLAFAEDGDASKSWFLVSRPTAMNEFIAQLHNEGYVRSSFSISSPPREIPPGLRQLLDLADFSEETSVILTRPPEISRMWIIFSKHKTAFLACSYSS